MNLAVRFYSSEQDSPVGIPEEWPVEVRELGESTSLPGDTWTLLTVAEYSAHRAVHRAAYNAWAATQ